MIDALRRLLARVTSDISQQCTTLVFLARSQILMQHKSAFSRAKRAVQESLSTLVELCRARAQVELVNCDAGSHGCKPSCLEQP